MCPRGPDGSDMSDSLPLSQDGSRKRLVFVGRDPDNDLPLRHPSISARHARIIIDADGMWLEDLGSRNGTFVGTQKRRVEREKITLDEQITFGEYILPRNALRDFLERTQPVAQDAGIVYLNESALVTFGRRKNADVYIDHPVASYLHASVSIEHGRVIINDLGSMTGTFVDGNRIEYPAEIKPGSLVQIANRRYRLSGDARSLEPVTTGADTIEAANVAVMAGGKRLLEGLSLVVNPGELVAIMGPSGSGKSTLLSVLNGTVVPTVGQIFIGGLDLHDHLDLFRGRIGYVPQDDILHPDLTVWQALWYAARLRLPTDTTRAEIVSRIQKVLAQLGLEGTEHTRVGDQRKRGVSGGQRKRVNLAMELLTDPPILILDEPTSGLSSTDALSVIGILRQLAGNGKTILVTIHQPGLDAFMKFDAVAVIARDSSTSQLGRLAYYGRAWPDAVQFFEPETSEGEMPVNAEGLLRGLARRPVLDWVRDWEKSVTKSIWVDRRSREHNQRTSRGVPPSPMPIARFRQWWTLIQRTVAVRLADRWGTAVLFLQAPIIGILVAAVFSMKLLSEPVSREEWGEVGIYMGVTMFVMALAAIWFGCSSTVREIVTEWPIYQRERMVGLSKFSYLASKTTVLLGVAGLQCALLLGIIAWSCGLQSSWSHLYVVLYAAALTGGGIGLFISASFRTPEAAAGVLPVLLLPMIMLGGILVPLGDQPRAIRILAGVMPSRWAFESLAVAEAQSRVILTVKEREPERPVLKPGKPEAGAWQAVPALMGRNTLQASNRGAQIHRVSYRGSDSPEECDPLGPFKGEAGKRFLLPGRQRIAEKLEEAVEKAGQEIKKAKESAESQSADIQKKMKAEFEKRSADVQELTREQIEKRLRDAQKEFELKLAEAQKNTRNGMEDKLREAEDNFKKQSNEAKKTTKEQLEKTLQETQAKFEKKSLDAELDIKNQMEKKLQETQAKFEKKSLDAELGTKKLIEAKLGDIKKDLETEQSRMKQLLEEKLGGTIVAPGEAVPKGEVRQDMANHFFDPDKCRSPDSLPLAMLAGMFVACLAGTGAMLHWRDKSI